MSALTNWRAAVDAHLPALDFWAALTPTLADDQAIAFVRLARENEQVGAFLDALLARMLPEGTFGASLDVEAVSLASPEVRAAIDAKGIPWATLIQLLPVILALFRK